MTMKALYCIVLTLSCLSCWVEAEELRAPRINDWLEKNFVPVPVNRNAGDRVWLHGSPNAQRFQMYPFRPLFADAFPEPAGGLVEWIHRSRTDSTETSVWNLYTLLNSPDARTRNAAEDWLTYGYLLSLWGTKRLNEGPNPMYPPGQVHDRINYLTGQLDTILRSKHEMEPDSLGKLKKLEDWLVPEEGTPIAKVQQYFDQSSGESFGKVRVEFVFPLSWHVRRNMNLAGATVKHYEEDQDYPCNLLVGGLRAEEGNTIQKTWLTEVYMHFLAGKLLVDGEFPPWVTAQDRASILMETQAWQSERQAFCERLKKVVQKDLRN